MCLCSHLWKRDLHKHTSLSHCWHTNQSSLVQYSVLNWTILCTYMWGMKQLSSNITPLPSSLLYVCTGPFSSQSFDQWPLSIQLVFTLLNYWHCLHSQHSVHSLLHSSAPPSALLCLPTIAPSAFISLTCPHIQLVFKSKHLHSAIRNSKTY